MPAECRKARRAVGADATWIQLTCIAQSVTVAYNDLVPAKAEMENATGSVDRDAGSALLRHGSWLLAAVGIGEIGLAVLLRSSVALSPLFAFLGTACVIIAVIVERAEAFELSPNRLRVALRALANRPEIRDATGEVVVEALEAQLDRSTRRRRLSKDLAEDVAAEVAVVRSSEIAAVDRAAEWLRTRGWNVEQVDRHGFPYDLVATREAESLYIDVKASPRPLDVDVIRRANAVLAVVPSVVMGQTRFAIWAATPGVTPAALQAAQQNGFILFVESPNGQVEQFG